METRSDVNQNIRGAVTPPRDVAVPITDPRDLDWDGLNFPRPVNHAPAPVKWKVST